MRTFRTILPCTVGLLLSQQALATDGYFAHGYGVKSLGMGGVGIALPQDAIAAATNPAGMGLIGDRIDVGVTWFKPDRETEISGSNAPPLNGTYDGNDTDHFFIPEFGFNHQFSDTVTLGVSVYGNGGMNTDYKNGIPYFNGGTNRTTGIDLAQLFIAPTVTWKVTPDHIVGLSLNLAYQRFEARGLQSFDNPAFTSSPGNVTNNGHDDSYGAGLRVGWIGKLNDVVSVGATYQSKTYMTEFDDYKGLFAEQGDFDIPATYGIGIAVKATPKWTIAADVQRILYSDVDSVGRASLSTLFAGNALGTDNGPGFGWEDVTVTKIGVAYAYSDALTLRAGYNHTTQPIRGGETFFNILAPGVVQDHLTLGGTYVLPDKGELSFFYAHVFEETVKGSNSIPGPGTPFFGGEADLRMKQNSFGVAYGWKY